MPGNAQAESADPWLRADALSREPVIKQGYLLKKSPHKTKGYQRRWFILTPFWLRYYKMHSKPRQVKKGEKKVICEKKGEIPIPCIQVVRQMVLVQNDGAAVKGRRASRYSFADTTLLDDRFAIDFGASQRQFLLKANTVEEANLWVQFIELAMKAYTTYFSTGPKAGITVSAKWWKSETKEKHKPGGADMPQLTGPEQWEYWAQAKVGVQCLSAAPLHYHHQDSYFSCPPVRQNSSLRIQLWRGVPRDI
jgi:hypothetical protein